LVIGHDPDRQNRRLIAYLGLVLAAVTGMALLLSFFVGGPFSALREVSMGLRLGVTGLVLGFAALVLERHSGFTVTSARRMRDQVLTASVDNRLKVVDAVVASSVHLGTSPSFDDILTIVLDSAVEIGGATSGAIDFFEKRDTDLAVAQRSATSGAAGAVHGRSILPLPLYVGDMQVGTLTLTYPPASRGPDDGTKTALTRYSKHAASTLNRAWHHAQERESRAYLEASNLVKSRFLTTISHELRTPLTSIIGYSKTLNNHWSRLDADQKRDFVREIEVQGNKMNRLVERILEAARVELQGVVIQPVEHDVRHSIEKAVAPFMATDADRIKLALPDRPIEAEIDPFVVDQVVSNLLDNGLRYTKGLVRLSLDSYRSSITIVVSDQGPGIANDRLNLVLEPLYRIDENVQSGTGLGLHIVRTLVEAHGGRGEIRSGSTGTSIAVKLPRATGSRITGRVPEVEPVRKRSSI
jgi:signal transduction histidine kinase